jgi:hypothetical protein
MRRCKTLTDFSNDYPTLDDADRNGAMSTLLDLGPVAAYRDAFPDWVSGLRWVPEHMRDEVVRWVLFGELPNPFLREALEGDLRSAAIRSEGDCTQRLYDWPRFFCECTPAGCFGSPEAVRRWAEAGGAI